MALPPTSLPSSCSPLLAAASSLPPIAAIPSPPPINLPYQNHHQSLQPSTERLLHRSTFGDDDEQRRTTTNQKSQRSTGEQSACTEHSKSSRPTRSPPSATKPPLSKSIQLPSCPPDASLRPLWHNNNCNNNNNVSRSPQRSPSRRRRVESPCQSSSVLLPQCFRRLLPNGRRPRLQQIPKQLPAPPHMPGQRWLRQVPVAPASSWRRSVPGSFTVTLLSSSVRLNKRFVDPDFDMVNPIPFPKRRRIDHPLYFSLGPSPSLPLPFNHIRTQACPTVGDRRSAIVLTSPCADVVLRHTASLFQRRLRGSSGVLPNPLGYALYCGRPRQKQ
ncbi:hypothetical protein DFJ73DRAFT_849929 [Zopfochytrium polystomum]|nr:hypothetical protein DFJ73DRAFT_849929 [Zopfochytrium polystomum]